MDLIRLVDVRIRTGVHPDAGTDSYVYLGLGGREFLLDTLGDDFAWASISTFQLGLGSTVKNVAENDPTNPPIVRDQVRVFPIYLHMEIDGSGPGWNVSDVTVGIEYESGDVDQFSRDFTFGTGTGLTNLWLGQDTGKRIYIKRYKV